MDNNILDKISSMVDDSVNNNLKGNNMNEDTGSSNPTREEWLETNTDGPNGVRLQRFRRTNNQMERGLSIEEAFDEYIDKRNGTQATNTEETSV